MCGANRTFWLYKGISLENGILGMSDMALKRSRPLCFE